jgi:hypothetical protein
VLTSRARRSTARRVSSLAPKSSETATAGDRPSGTLAKRAPVQEIGDRSGSALKSCADWIFPPRDEIHRPVAALLKAQTQ